MSNDIKAGDLVMIVKPTDCCNTSKNSGKIFQVAEVGLSTVSCLHCGYIMTAHLAFMKDGRSTEIRRLKKIDPPATGDSLPTRADQPIKHKEPA